MDIKDELFLNSMTWAEADEVENNTIGAFQTCNSNTPGYYIFRWTVNSYNIQEQYICHALYPPFKIPECGLVFPAKFMTPMRKTSYWYYEPDEEILVMVKLKSLWCLTFNWLSTTIQQINCHHVLKDTLIWTLIYYMNTIIKLYWIKFSEEKILIMRNMCNMKITTM